MAQTYSVRVVSPSEWDRLAKCEHMDEGTMGYADPQTHKAYVRDTHLHDLNRYLVGHEFNHLLEVEGTDECPCGLRHKKLMDLFKRAGIDLQQKAKQRMASAPTSFLGAQLPLGQLFQRQQAQGASPLGLFGPGINEVEGRLYGPNV